MNYPVRSGLRLIVKRIGGATSESTLILEYEQAHFTLKRKKKITCFLCTVEFS